ncbi:Protein FLX-like 4 [Abeliophyllum distichum]|uniref:Protein FLX-like 4 n=1 Tax=Abeliophyllum distichum TaxID=126358 RepID=A0ABD1QXZ2_9LAMI
MASRRNIPLGHEGRSGHAPGMMRHGPLSAAHRPTEPRSPAFLENKFVSQASELESLSADNHKLTSAHVALRQDLAAAQQEVEKLREHIRSTQTEGDIQIRILLDKIAKWEADIRAGERVKKDLQQAHLEARSLVTAKQELTGQIQKANQDLDKARDDLKKLPEMSAELNCLSQEHQRLRKTFEYEKGLNIEKVEQMKIMEKDLIGMAEEVERLRAEVLTAEKKAHVPTPYGGLYMNPNPSYPHPINGNVGYVDNFGRPLYMGGGAVGEGMIPYGSGTTPAVNPSWGGSYDTSHTLR